MKPANLLPRLTALLALVPVTTADVGDTERVSVGPSGAEGDFDCESNAISADGRYVAFETFSTTLVAGDTNFASDIFVRDRQTGQTTRVSVATDGTQGNSSSYAPDLSDDGRYVLFTSTASNLVANDFNNANDVFLHDRLNGKTARVSLGSTGAELNGPSKSARLSADGRYVVFVTDAPFVVPGVAGGPHVYRRDLATSVTTLVSSSASGAPGDGASDHPAISDDGQAVAFESASTNLVAGDTNGQTDVFVRDLASSQTVRVSVTTSGDQAFSYSQTPSISADGRRVAFAGRAQLVPFDLNGLDDVYLHDRDTGETELVTVDVSGGTGDSFSFEPSISADGVRVAFHSRAPDLVSGDGNFLYDVFVRDTALGQTTRASVDSAGAAGDDDSLHAALSADGGAVAFVSEAANLVLGDGNARDDVFAHTVDFIGPATVEPLTAFASSEAHVAIATVQPAGAGRGASTTYVADVTAGLPSSGVELASAQYRAHLGTAATPAQLSSSGPLVFGAAPSYGAAPGGESVAVHGFNLAAVPAVTLGGVPTTGASPVTNTVVAATTGPGTNGFGNPLGVGDVVVTTLAGTSAATDAFVYGPALAEDEPPRVGEPYALDVHLRAGDVFQIAVGASIPGVAAPVWPLAGAAEILVGVSFVTGLTAAPGDVVTLSLPVPANPSLAGAPLELQGAVLSSLSPLAGSFTNRLETTVEP